MSHDSTSPIGRARRRTAPPEAAPAHVGRILVVGANAPWQQSLVDRLEARDRACMIVADLARAQSALMRQPFDLIILDPALPDGDGLTLCGFARRLSPATKTIVFGDAREAAVAESAIRTGAVDLIGPSVTGQAFLDRVDDALLKSMTDRAHEQRVRQLQRMCGELNVARDEIAEEIDGLCRTLHDAYQELTDQMNDVAIATEFRTLLRMELDMEEMLRTTLEYLLTKTGPTNAAVFLPDVDEHFNLGAYVNYDCPRDSIDRLLEYLGTMICPQMMEEREIVAFDDAAEFADWVGLDSSFIGDAQVLAFSCHHQERCLAIVVLFRNRSTPYDEKLAATLDILRAIFAEQLAQIIKIHHRARPEWPDEPADEFGLGFDDYDCGEDIGGMAA